jgi:hypothetical protein
VPVISEVTAVASPTSVNTPIKIFLPLNLLQ